MPFLASIKPWWCGLEFIISPADGTDLPRIMEILKMVNMHNIPSPEMPELDLNLCLVARCDGAILGMCGFKMLSAETGKTTLLAVDPQYRMHGVGRALQLARMERMIGLGAKRIITNADRPESIEWYKKHFGYREVGKLKKAHEFGHPGIDRWTTLELDVSDWMSRNGRN